MVDITLEVQEQEPIDLSVDEQHAISLEVADGGAIYENNYNNLTNKPKINSVELSGNKSLSDLSIYSKSETDTLLNNKVDKVQGKGLSENDFTNTLKSKLDGIENGANKTTKTSQLVNDSGFITEHQSLSGYATEQWVENKGYLTQHQDISGKENISNKVTSLSSSSTNTQYPSAKCVYDIVGNIEATLQAIRGV